VLEKRESRTAGEVSIGGYIKRNKGLDKKGPKLEKEIQLGK
jgi:hypothetical protein